MLLWTDSFDQTLYLMNTYLGPQNDFNVEILIRGVNLMQALGGFFIIINHSKVGAQLLFLSFCFHASTQFNPWLNGFSFEKVNLFLCEISLMGLCFLLYSYENSLTPEVDPKVKKQNLQTKMAARNKPKAKTD